MICVLVPFSITGRIWRMWPPSTITLAPNGLFLKHSWCLLIISLSDRSKASKHRLSVISASSHRISDVSIIKSANWDPRLMSYIEVSSISNHILNLECAVLPFGNNKAATPEDATVRTIFFLPLDMRLLYSIRMFFLFLHIWIQNKKLNCFAMHYLLVESIFFSLFNWLYSWFAFFSSSKILYAISSSISRLV